MIKGTVVSLAVKVEAGTDELNRPIYNYEWVDVENVLVAQPETSDIVNTVDIVGKKNVYVLGIPKGDGHEWENTRVRFFGKEFKTFGNVIQGIEANVPTAWHKKIMVEAYE